MKKNEFMKFLVLILCLIILGFTVYSCFRHVDFFLNKKKSLGDVLSISDPTNGSGKDIRIRYVNEYDSKTYEKRVNVSNSFIEEHGNEFQQVDIYYTKWSNQLFLAGYQTPRLGIFVFDLVVIILMCIGIKYGLSKEK